MLKDIDTTKKQIQCCFNKAASTYDSNNVVQQIIGANLITHLDHHQIPATQIIDLGCGSGVITERLAGSLPYTLFHAIDISNALLALAKNRLAPYPIKVYEHDFEQLAINNTLFDLAFSNMALHWSVDLEKTLQKIHQHLLTDGVIAFSVPIAGTFAELKPSSINPFYSLRTIANRVSKTGFDIIEQSTEIIAINFESVIAALKSIKAVGANCLFKQPNNSLKGRSFLQKITASNNAAIEQFALTYRIGYIIARKR